MNTAYTITIYILLGVSFINFFQKKSDTAIIGILLAILMTLFRIVFLLEGLQP